MENTWKRRRRLRHWTWARNFFVTALLRKNVRLLIVFSLSIFCIGLFTLLQSSPERDEIQIYNDDIRITYVPEKQRNLSIGIIEVVRASTSPEEYHTAMTFKKQQYGTM
ncbi:unnamed protein product [Cylicocyclus nassatus]|uniref:Uncharacterized protein n=1 Tax=Cylicocyclus nassatus TaxID=53992 RepID=A0AA36DQG3_CYLNA|nr:unnamed protein product [Cylicocyclus nassatus]